MHLQTLWTSGLHRKNSRGCTVIVGQWTTLVGHIMYIQSKSAALLILILNEITLGRRACMQHGRGVVITSPPTVRYSEQILYAAILRRASHCVRYPELRGSWTANSLPGHVTPNQLFSELQTKVLVIHLCSTLDVK